MVQATVSFLDLPSETLLRIFHAVSETSASDSRRPRPNGRLIAEDHGRDDAHDSRPSRFPLLALTTSCRRFNSLFRANVGQVIFENTYPPAISARVLQRFPAAKCVEVDLSQCGGVVEAPRTQDVEAFICNVLEARVDCRTMKLGCVETSLTRLHQMMGTCSALEELELSAVSILVGGWLERQPFNWHQVSVFPHQPMLRKVVFNDVTFGTDGLCENATSCWFDSAALPKLQDLKLSRLILSEETFDSLASLASLESLSLCQVQVSNTVLERFLSQLSGLRFLRLERMALPSHAVLSLPVPLEHLEVHDFCALFSDSGNCTSRLSKPAPGMLREPSFSLAKLLISQSRCEQLDYLLPRASSLKEFAFRLGDFDPEGEAYLDSSSLVRFLLECTALTSLELSGSNCSNIWPLPSVFAAISQLRSLKKLTLEYPSQVDSGKQLEGCTVVSKNIPEENLQADIVVLACGPCHRSLETLTIRANSNETAWFNERAIDSCRQLVKECFDSCLLVILDHST